MAALQKNKEEFGSDMLYVWVVRGIQKEREREK
jgi:hypothetical protein